MYIKPKSREAFVLTFEENTRCADAAYVMTIPARDEQVYSGSATAIVSLEAANARSVDACGPAAYRSTSCFLFLVDGCRTVN